jgi:energy-coupling factor transport system ATP-binding protein
MQLVFDKVDFRRERWLLQASCIFGPGTHLISGPVGSGKSTMALLASGFLEPDRGEVRQEGIRSSVLSLQFPEYHVTAQSLLKEVGSWGLDEEQVLTQAGLLKRRKDDPAWLSRGELKRLELACAMAIPHDLLVFDEPFSSLDCDEKEMLCRRLSPVPAGIVLLFTHETWFLPRVDEIHVLESGRLKSLGKIPEAIGRWPTAPRHIRELVRAGFTPANLDPASIGEAACRMHESA